MPKQTSRSLRTRHKLPKRGAGKRAKQTKQGAGLITYGESSITDSLWKKAVTAVGGLVKIKRVLNLL